MKFNKEKILTENSKLTFGKYKGKTIKLVLAKEPSYIVWCIENRENFANRIDTNLEELAYRLAFGDTW